MPIFWDLPKIHRRMRDLGISSQQELNRVADLSRLTMHNITRSGPLTRIDVPTLEKLAKALDVKPLDLLRYEPD